MGHVGKPNLQLAQTVSKPSDKLDFTSRHKRQR